jgi:predicted transcriptional regulator
LNVKIFERQHGERAPDVLKELLERHGSQKAVADYLGVSQTSISLWMIRYRLKFKVLVVREDQEMVG